MRSDLSAWVVWVCPRCGFEVTRHENTPLETWCIYCNVHLVAAEAEVEGGPGVIRVGGLAYWQIKCRALNGGRSRLSDEQLGFVGVARQQEVRAEAARPWAPAGASPRLLEQQQVELAAFLDTPGWVRLAREIVNPK